MTQRRFFNLFLFIVLAFLLVPRLYGETLSELLETLDLGTDAEVEERLHAADIAYNEYIEYLSELRSSFAAQMENEFNLKCSNYQGRMHKTIERLGMDFHAERRATIEEARALTLSVLEKFVDAINSDERLQPFLKTRPFTHKKVILSIIFKGINGRYADGSVYHVFFVKPVASPQCYLFYDAQDPFVLDSDPILKETYEEAVRLNNLFPIKNPDIHQVTEKEEAIDTLLYDFREQMRVKHGLECWSIGGDMNGKIENIGAKFVVLHQATQEQARNLLLDITQSLLAAVNDCIKLQPYLAEDPFPADRLKLRLCFKKKRTYGTYRNGTMESATLDDGKITYFREVPEEQSKKLLYIPDVERVAAESYKEALEVVENAPRARFFSKNFRKT